MDKMSQYGQLLENIISELPDMLHTPSEGSEVETHAIFDQKRHRYMIYRSGWQEQKRINMPVLYVRVHRGKIWIEEDWSEDGITPQLLAAGVPREDIVLGFRHPTVRPLTDFAVA